MKYLVLLLLLLPRPLSAQTLTVLHAFTGGTDGARPNASVIEGPYGLLFGTAANTTTGAGIFYAMTPDGSGYWSATIPAFANSNNPQGLVQAIDGNLYGTTMGGAYGEIYRADGMLTPIHAFAGAPTGGAYATRPMVRGPNGYLYGVTEGGGLYDAGTIFTLSLAGTVTTIYTFNTANGYAPLSLLQAADGSFYGLTQRGGAYGLGTIFKLVVTGSAASLTTIYSFNGGTAPYSLIQGSDGLLYGTTRETSTRPDGGCVFRIRLDGSAFTLLRCLQRKTEGETIGTLLEAADGNFYSVTESGGAYGAGTLLRITRYGKLIVLWTFTIQTGVSPRSPLIQGSDGAFYGTTRYGGTGCPPSTGGCGVIYKYSCPSSMRPPWESIPELEGAVTRGHR